MMSTIETSNNKFDNSLQKSNGRPHTDESRAKISAANKGKTPWNVGKQHSIETKQKIAENTRLAMLKIKESKALELGLTIEKYDELNRTKKKIKQKQTIKGGLTIEGRKKISDSLKRRWDNPEFRLNYTSNYKGRNHSEETKLRISNAIKLKWKNNGYQDKINSTITQEIREKISQTLKLKWENQEFRDKMTSNFLSRGSEWKATLSAKIKEKWNDPEYRLAVSHGIRRSYKINGTINNTKRRNYNYNKIDLDIANEKRNENIRKKEIMKANLLNRVKKRVYNKTLNGRRIKELLGSELWFEEKLKRKRENDVMVDDMTLEKILLSEWSSDSITYTNKNDKSYNFNYDNDIEYENENDEEKLKSQTIEVIDYGQDDDVIEVYDESGQLIGTYTEEEFQRIRSRK